MIQDTSLPIDGEDVDGSFELRSALIASSIIKSAAPHGEREFTNVIHGDNEANALSFKHIIFDDCVLQDRNNSAHKFASCSLQSHGSVRKLTTPCSTVNLLK